MLKRPYDELDELDRQLVDDHAEAENRTDDCQWQIDKLEEALRQERAALSRHALEADDLWCEMVDRGLV